MIANFDWQSNQASGFCYINDVVLAILELLQPAPAPSSGSRTDAAGLEGSSGGGGDGSARSFERVLYVDIDVHHCDGVEQAFEATDRVFRLSFHHLAKGFFPGTGRARERGQGRGRFHSLNVPLREGICDKPFCSLFATGEALLCDLTIMLSRCLCLSICFASYNLWIFYCFPGWQCSAKSYVPSSPAQWYCNVAAMRSQATPSAN